MCIDNGIGMTPDKLAEVRYKLLRTVPRFQAYGIDEHEQTIILFTEMSAP